MAGQTAVSRAMEIIVKYYKERELRLARELVKEHGYTYKNLGDLQDTTKQAAQQYYGKFI